MFGSAPLSPLLSQELRAAAPLIGSLAGSSRSHLLLSSSPDISRIINIDPSLGQWSVQNVAHRAEHIHRTDDEGPRPREGPHLRPGKDVYNGD